MCFIVRQIVILFVIVLMQDSINVSNLVLGAYVSKGSGMVTFQDVTVLLSSSLIKMIDSARSRYVNAYCDDRGEGDVGNGDVDKII